MIDVAIIGGGVSGLATAYALRCLGHDVAVLERQVRPGGNAISERINGFLMEHGPSSLSAAAPEALGLSRELGLDEQHLALGPEVRRRYLVKGERLQAIATHPLGFVTSGYLSLAGRARILTEVLMPRKKSDREETVAEFWRRRFGVEFSDRVIDPLVGGLFAGAAAELSMPAVFPGLLHMERAYGSLILAALCARLAGGKMPGRRLFSWREGVAALPRALAQRLRETVRTGVVARRIEHRAGGFRVQVARAGTALQAKAVVLAVQPHVAAALLSGIDVDGAAAAASIDAPPLAVIFLGFRREQVEHPLDGLGYLAPAGMGLALTGAQFCSTMFAGRAPQGHVALAGYLGGARDPHLATRPAAELVAIARTELRDLLGTHGEPVISRVRQWPRGLPQYRLGHCRRVATLGTTHERTQGVFVTGNYLAGPSVAACLTQATQTAARIHEFLRKASPKTWRLTTTSQMVDASRRPLKGSPVDAAPLIDREVRHPRYAENSDAPPRKRGTTRPPYPA